jgi:hypothetical protein
MVVLRAIGFRCTVVDAEAVANRIGAAGYLAKPFGLTELLDLLERH